MQYTTDIRIVRLMCTGRVDPAIVAEAFVNGADGVMVVGCHFGDCRYISGNIQGPRDGLRASLRRQGKAIRKPSRGAPSKALCRVWAKLGSV